MSAKLVLDLFELITGLRMNHAYVRPGGAAQDLPAGGIATVRDSTASCKGASRTRGPLQRERHFQGALAGSWVPGLAGCMALGITGPILRSTGLPGTCEDASPTWATTSSTSTSTTWDTCDSYGRFRIRLDEMVQSLRIIDQVVDRLDDLGPGSVMVEDRKIAWPADS